MRTPLKVLICVIVELTYAIFTRTWLRSQLGGTELEIAISTARLVTLAVYWTLFRDLTRRPKRFSITLKIPLVLTGAATALAIPFLFQGGSPGGGMGTDLVFAVTSIIVGLREELLYRAILLNLLVPRTGKLSALLISTGFFVIYHYGALPATVLVITEVVCLSLMFGLIYITSASLFAVAAFHAAYDGIWCFGPYLTSPLGDKWRPVFLIAALVTVILGTWRSAKKTQIVDKNGAYK